MNIMCIEAKTFTKKQIMNNHKAMIIREKQEVYESELKRIKELVNAIDFNDISYSADKRCFLKAMMKSIKRKV